MFKKLVKIGGQNQLSGKDRKLLKNDLSKQMGVEEIEHFFTKNEKIICYKVSGGKTLIYVGDDYPAFVDGTGKGDFFPSLYALGAYPAIIRYLTLNEGVELYIFNGANLMWPGVSDYSTLGDFKKDEVVAIKNAKNEFIAVAALAIDKKDLNEYTKKGVACYILHYMNDKLWEHGSKSMPMVQLAREIKKEELVKKYYPVKKEEPLKKEYPKEEKKEEQKKKEEMKKEENTKGQKKKEEKVEKKEEPKKYQPKEEKKELPKQPYPESSEEEEDASQLAALLHTKKQNQQQQQPAKKVQVKEPSKFSDDEDDKKKKKGKKPQQKQKYEEVEKEKPKAKGKKQYEDGDYEEYLPKKPKKKDNSDEYVEEKKKPSKKRKGTDEGYVEYEKATLSPHLMDDCFKEALLNALKLGVNDDDLPLDSGAFYTDYILPARRYGVVLDIKQSSYKKMNKFYEAMDRLGIIEFKQGKQKSGAVGPTINKIHRDNELLSEHVPTIKKLAQKDQYSDQEAYSFLKHDPKLKFQLSKTVEVQEVYRLVQNNDKKKEYVVQEPNILEFLFPPRKKYPYVPKESAPGPKPRKYYRKTFDPYYYYTYNQVKLKVNNYLTELESKSVKKVYKMDTIDEYYKIVKEKKEKQYYEEDKKKQKVYKTLFINYQNDKFLQYLLKYEIYEHEHFLSLKKEEEEADEYKQKEEKEKTKKKKDIDTHDKKLLKISRDDIEKKVMEHLEPFHQITDKATDLMEFRQGRFKGIEIVAEKNNGKNVTNISGLYVFILPRDKQDQQITNFSHLLQQKFNTSVSVHNLPKKGAGKELMIQGTFIDELQEMLSEDYRIKKEYISTKNKLDKKKKN